MNWKIHKNRIWIHIIKLIVDWITQEVQKTRYDNSIFPDLKQNIPLKKIAKLRDVMYNIFINSRFSVFDIKIDLWSNSVEHNFQTFNITQKLIFGHALGNPLRACLDAHLNRLCISE